METPTCMIEANDLHRSFGAREAVAGISFRVSRGEIFGLLGPNGAGNIAQDIGLPVGLQGFRDQGMDLRSMGDIGLDKQGCPPSLLNLKSRGCPLFVMAVGDDDLHAFLCQHAGDSSPYTRGSSGDNGDFACQFKVHRMLPLS